MAKVEALILGADQFIKPAIFLEQIQIIEAGDKEDVPDPEAHEILKALEPVAIAMLDQKGVERANGLVILMICMRGSHVPSPAIYETDGRRETLY
jgi:hypothetical protein